MTRKFLQLGSIYWYSGLVTVNENFVGNGLTSVACQSFAGAFDLGMTQAGFELLHKVERKGGFGSKNVLANKAMIGNGEWSYEDGDHTQFFDVEADVVYGNPPCSGFSVMSTQDFRGMDSTINECMHVLIEYAARCTRQMVIFESVQQAYWIGRPLMRLLRDKFEVLTGLEGRVYLNHVLHNVKYVGNTQERRRYFMVLTVDRPFIVHDSPVILDYEDRTLRAAIGDLEAQPLAVEPREYVVPHMDSRVSEYAINLRSDTYTVDGHCIRPNQWVDCIHEFLADFKPWGQGETLGHVLERHYQKTGDLHPRLSHVREKILARRTDEFGLHTGFGFGSYNQPRRFKYDEASWVITGGTAYSACHPTADRMMSFREIARIMGYTDDWLISPSIHSPGFAAWWGKQIVVEAGKWIGDNATMWFDEEVKDNLDPDSGVVIGDRERVFEHTAWPRRDYDQRKDARAFNDSARGPILVAV